MIASVSIQGALRDQANNDVWDLVGSGAPTNGTSGTAVGLAGPGSTYTDYTNKLKYINSNTKASPTWIAFITTTGAQTLSSKTFVAPVLGVATGTSLAVTGLITSSSPSAGIGYATGAGGTVAQITSKATAVSLNTLSGAITCSNATLNAATVVSFTLTNTSIAATDVLILNHISGGTPGSYTLNARAAAGSATIDIRNNSAGNLSEAIVIQFAVIKAVNA